MQSKELSLKVNGKAIVMDVKTNARLIDFLRNYLKLTGTKEGCSEGECGACTVLINDQPVDSCLVMAHSCEGKEVTTIEGLGTPEAMHPVQQAFLDQGAVQCGFCTPGMVLVAYALLKTNPNPTKEEIKAAMSGNLCRCTGYGKIVAAVESAAAKGEKSR